LEKELEGINECPYCGGVSFQYEIKVLSFETLTDEEMERVRERVREGAQIREIAAEFELDIGEMTYWECEKCGLSDASPRHTTM